MVDTSGFGFAVEETSEVKLPPLEMHQKYFWRVDTQNPDGSVLKGKLWNFMTGGIVAWWRFDGIEDRIAVDSSDNGLDGKLIGDVQIISDPERGSVLRKCGAKE